MTLRHMKIFVEVCSEESITKAAENLNMSQPTVSIAIKELEGHYHTKLFERMNRRIYLTEKGQELYQYAQTIVNQFAEAENRISGNNTDYVLRIGCNVSYGVTKLTDIMEKYQTEYPDIKYHLQIANSNQIEKMLLQNELDFAIVDNVNVSVHFVSKLIAQEKMLAFCGKEYAKIIHAPLSITALGSYPLLLRESGSGSRNVIDQVFQLQGLHINPIMESTSTLAIIQAAIHNLGICILPESLIPTSLVDELTQIKLADNYFMRRYFLIHHRNKYISDKMNNFFKYYNL